MTKKSHKEIIYVGDPMCAWCFGFAPVLDALMERFETTIHFRFIMGGLRVGNPTPITEAMKPRLLENWHNVTKATGQPINGHLLSEAPEFLYDSGPASRAFVAVRRLDEALALPYYQRLHHAFYMEMKDITTWEVLWELAEEVGVDRSAFYDLFHAGSVRRETEADFKLAAACNALAFPALVLKEGPTASVLNQGYKPLASLSDILSHWVTGSIATSDISPALLIFGIPA